MLLHEGGDNQFVVFEGLYGGSFVVLHHATVIGDIGAEVGSELAVKTFQFHAVTSLGRRFGKSRLKKISPKQAPVGF